MESDFRTAVLVAIGLSLPVSCSRDVRLSGKKVPTVKVGVVEHFGMKLDQEASPEQVVFVALRAIREDHWAATPEARNEALAVQFDVCAANEIQARNNSSLSRDEYIYKTVRRWTPTVSHYSRNFAVDWDEARSKLIRREKKSVTPLKLATDECEVLLPVEDPSGDPKARAVMIAWVVKDGGFWRVVHFGFDPTLRWMGSAGAAAETGPPRGR